MTSHRIALLLATLSVAAAAAMQALVVSRLNNVDAGADSRRMLLWTIVPVTLTIVGRLTARRERNGIRWMAIGALWGFVIATAWSLGFFFAPAAILLLASGIVETHARGTRLWNAVFALLWMLEGLFGLVVVMLAVLLVGALLGNRYVVFPGQTREFSTFVTSVAFSPEALTFGTWMFMSVSSVLAAWQMTRVVWGKRGRRAAARGGSGCESSGTGTTCWSR